MSPRRGMNEIRILLLLRDFCVKFLKVLIRLENGELDYKLRLHLRVSTLISIV